MCGKFFSTPTRPGLDFWNTFVLYSSVLPNIFHFKKPWLRLNRWQCHSFIKEFRDVVVVVVVGYHSAVMWELELTTFHSVVCYDDHYTTAPTCPKMCFKKTKGSQKPWLVNAELDNKSLWFKT